MVFSWAFYPGTVDLQFGDVGFYVGKNKQQTQPIYDAKPESNPGHIGGRQVFSPLHHPFS